MLTYIWQTDSDLTLNVCKTRIQQNEKKQKLKKGEHLKYSNTNIQNEKKQNLKKTGKRKKNAERFTLILDFQSSGRMFTVPAINLSLYQRQSSTAVRHKIIGLTVRAYVCAYLYTMHMYCKLRTITPRSTIIIVSQDDRLLNCDPSSINHITWLRSVRSHGPKYLKI